VERGTGRRVALHQAVQAPPVEGLRRRSVGTTRRCAAGVGYLRRTIV